MGRRKSDARRAKFVTGGRRLLITTVVALVLLGLSLVNLLHIGLTGVAFDRVYGAGTPPVATMPTPLSALPLPGFQATPTSTATPQPPSPPETTATPTEMPPPSPTPTDTPAPTDTVAPTNTPTSSVSPPPGKHGVSAHVFIDYQCDGVFQSGVDVSLDAITIRLNLARGSLTRQTTSSGMVHFAGVDLSDGGSISIEGLSEVRYQGCYVHACARSSVDLRAGDFQPGQIAHKHVDFRLHPAYDPWSVGGATPAPPLGTGCGGGTSTGQAAERPALAGSAAGMAPAATPEPVSPPATVSKRGVSSARPWAGAGVTGAPFQSLADEMGAELDFDTFYRDETGHLHAIGEMGRGTVLVEFVGSPDGLISASISLRPAGGRPNGAGKNADYMLTLLRSVVPDWVEGPNWLIANLDEVGQPDAVKTTHDNVQIVLERIGGFGVTVLTVGASPLAASRPGMGSSPAEH